MSDSKLNKYQDLEDLLFKGFIPFKINVNGLNLVLKTVNEYEYSKIKLMSGLESDPRYSVFFNINLLFYSIFMVDGINILNVREDHYCDIIDEIKKFPSPFFRVLFSLLEELAKRQNNCSNQVEQYSLGGDSRYNWETRKKYLINSSSLTTIPGTDLLGLSQYQRYWSALNLREDKKESFEQQYGLFKFLASFQDPKSVKKIDAQDKAKKEEDDKRKERLRVIGTEEEIQYLSGHADTREGIVKELERQISGDKDQHDLFIESYEKKIRKEMLMRMHEMSKVRENRKKEMEDMGEEVRSISKTELEERIKRIKEKKERNMASYDSTSEQNSKFYQMSNVRDSDIIREEDFLSEEDYEKLTGDETFKAVTGVDSEKAKSKKIEDAYQRQQRTLASKFNYEDEVNFDFPHVKR